MPTLKWLFWNLDRRPLVARIARLAQVHAIDVVVLAECATPRSAVAAGLTRNGAGVFSPVSGTGAELHVYDRIPQANWTLLIQDDLEAWSGLQLTAPGLTNLGVVVAHLPSKLRATEADQALTGRELADDIRHMEDHQLGHERTVVVGDLNANPFERPVAEADALHGVMTRRVAAGEEREIRRRPYRFFYNPMWAAFGDRTPGPPGTFYRSASQSVNYFWNTYDQVLVRPSIMNGLTEVEVLTTDGTDSLLTATGLPDTVTGSDHLPLVFRLTW